MTTALGTINYEAQEEITAALRLLQGTAIQTISPLEQTVLSTDVFREEEHHNHTTPAALFSPLTIEYSFQEDQFCAENPGTAAIDYHHLWYGERTANNVTFQSEEEYFSTTVPEEDTAAALATVQEAQQIAVEIQYSAALGSLLDVGYQERQKFAVWVQFNKSMLGLFQSLYAITREVDYSRLV